MDGGPAYYAMPSPRAFSKSREPSPNKGINVSRSGSRRRSTMTSSERPVIQLQEGHRHRSYHTTDGHLAAGASMGRSLSVSDRRPGAGIRVASTGGVHVNYAKDKRPVSHNRAASQGGPGYHDDGYRRRPASYYAGSAYHGSHGSGYSPTFDHSPSHSPYQRHSPVGSYSKSPTRHARDPSRDSRHLSYTGIGPVPLAPMPPAGYTNPDDELARLVQAKLELERLKESGEDRGRTTERMRALEQQTAVAMARREERERARQDAEIRANHMEFGAVVNGSRPQHIVVHPQAAPKPKTPAPPAAPPAKKDSHPPPPKNLNDYQAKVPKNLISRAALVEKGLPYEEHKDYLLVRRYLGRDDIKALLERTEEIRKQRAVVEKYRAAQAAKAAKEAEEAARPKIYRHTTTGGQNVHIVTVPAKPAEPVKDWREERKEFEERKKAEADRRAKEDAELKRREDHFKAMEAAEKSHQPKVQQKPRRGWFS